MLVSDPILNSDENAFLEWCKLTCEQGSVSNKQVINMKEVGEFFSEKINNEKFNVKKMTEVGFQFLQAYFISSNEENNNIIKIS